MSTPSWLRLLIASWKIKIIGSPAAMSTPSLAATADHGELGNKDYSLACNVNALVAVTANRELKSKNYWLASSETVLCPIYGV